MDELRNGKWWKEKQRALLERESYGADSPVQQADEHSQRSTAD